MVLETSAEILFTSSTKPCISLETTAKGNREKFQEILLFCCFAADQAVKIEKNYGHVSTLLALLLVNTSGNLGELAKSKTIGGAPSSGRTRVLSRRSIVAQLTCRTSGDVVFRSHHKGWYLSRWNRACHSANGVLLLLKHLAHRRMEDTAYLNTLGRAASAVGSGYIQGQLSNGEAVDAAMMMALKAAGAFPLEDLTVTDSVRPMTAPAFSKPR